MELQTTTGLRSDGVYVLVDNVERGKACDCVCPACQTPLIARQGQKVRWHFAHESSANITRHCSESDLHLSTKLAIAESKTLSVPAIYKTKPVYHAAFNDIAIKHFGWNVFSKHQITFDNVKVEKSKDGYIPDLIATSNKIEYLIEVVVTHDIDESKMNWIIGNNLNCIRVYPTKDNMDWAWSNHHSFYGLCCEVQLLMGNLSKKNLEKMEFKDVITIYEQTNSSLVETNKKLKSSIDGLERTILNIEKDMYKLKRENVILEIEKLKLSCNWSSSKLMSKIAEVTNFKKHSCCTSLDDYRTEDLELFLKLEGSMFQPSLFSMV